jgi:diguanylate cyclase (GGDEF)-like protein
MKPLETESLAHLQHELRTPINHILGYSELLIEDAGERHLEAFVPAFRQIHSSGLQLLESIQSTFAEKSISFQGPHLQALKENLRSKAAEVLEASTSILDELEAGHLQTLADLNVISGALCQLMEFTVEEGEPLVRVSTKPFVGMEQGSCENISAPNEKRHGTILIADDDPGNRVLLRRRLESEGHSVLEATNGLEVLALLKGHACDLVLLDIMMPEMDGFQTLAKLKKELDLRELPVIMISALDELRSVVRCIEMGAEDYLPKPFNRVLLRARVGASLEKKWLRDSERRKTDELEKSLRLLEQVRAQLEIQASQDALTQLANRRAVDSHLESRSKRETPFSVIYIDLNGFKRINDTYGHQAGDDLLKQVGDHLRLAFRPTDIVGRWGGDEFVALVDTGLADAQSYVSRITQGFSKEFVISSGEAEYRINVGAAVGVATWRPGETVAEVLQRADAEMYEQKLRNVAT